MKKYITLHGKSDLSQQAHQLSPNFSPCQTGSAKAARALISGAMLLFCLAQAFNASAQVANYSFAVSSGTYTALSGPTNVFTGAWDDNTAISVPIGFTFNFNGTGYTSVFVHPNGYLTFGSSTSGYTPISGGSAVSGVISAWGRDLQSQNTAPLGSVDYLSSGGVFTVQWSNTRRYNSTTLNAERFEMQIQLVQATGEIKMVYGTWSDAISALSTNVGEVGLRGTSGTDFKNLSVLSGGDWAAPAAGAVNTATCFYNETSVATKPALGLTYTYAPPPPCTAPSNQPTALVLTPSTSSVSGSFTAATSAPSGYLVVRTLTNVPPTPPVDGTAYTAGASALGGVIVSSGATTTFNATCLPPSTPYFFWVYSVNTGLCTGPAYQAASPLTATATTNACSFSGVLPVGAGSTNTTILSALNFLKAQGLAGPAIIELQTDYVPTGETYPVVLDPVLCASATNTITIRPAAGVAAPIVLATASAQTIDINGGKFYILDGRPGGTGTNKFLTISNTSTAGTAVRFINEGSTNVIRHCTLQGVNTSTVNAVVFFTTTTGTNGNDNNTIDNCDIRDGASTPTNGIYSSGTTTSVAHHNSGNTISNSKMFNTFNASSTSYAINISSGSTD